MKKFLSLLLLISFFFNCMTHIDIIRIDSSSAKSLYPSPKYDNYFYMENYYSDKNNIYFYIKDTGNGFSSDNLDFCYTNTLPDRDEDNPFHDCDNAGASLKKIIEHKSHNEYQNYDELYYLYEFYSPHKHDYLVIKYSLSTTNGFLSVQASYSDINDLVESLIGSGLTTLAIVLIEVGAIIGLSIIITIIVCCYIYKRKKTNVGNISSVQPLPSDVISNTTDSPLVAQTPANL